jgi:UPF0755 protein
MKRIVIALVVLCVVAAAIGYGAISWGKQQYFALNLQNAQQVIEIPKGSSVSGISDVLFQNQVLRSERDKLILKVALKYFDTGKTLKAGEYFIPENQTMAQVVHILHMGKAVQYKVTIPEGLTAKEIVTRLNITPHLTGRINTIPAEGSLLPDTYFYTKGDDRALIIQRMQQKMQDVLAQAWAGRAANIPLKTPQEMVTLASIVEKETGVAQERPLVAGVFVNRLNKGMKLQSDPTVMYGITMGQHDFEGPIRRSHLRTATAYNTYTIPALPPGPIANPGADAIRAVANPAPTKALFFVADGTGGHAFAETLQEHNRNVAKWRQIERSQ